MEKEIFINELINVKLNEIKRKKIKKLQKWTMFLK